MKVIAVEEHFMSKEVNDWYTKIYLGDTEMQRAYSKRNEGFALKGILTARGHRP